jgi:hypothetical protein
MDNPRQRVLPAPKGADLLDYYVDYDLQEAVNIAMLHRLDGVEGGGPLVVDNVLLPEPLEGGVVQGVVDRVE